MAKEHEMANIVLFLLLFLLVSVLFMLNLFDLCQSIASIAILLTIYFVFVDVGIDCIKANKNGFSGSTEANYASKRTTKRSWPHFRHRCVVVVERISLVRML